MVLGRLVPEYEQKSIKIKGNTVTYIGDSYMGLARRNHDHSQSTGSS